jgi:hypothetical protein
MHCRHSVPASTKPCHIPLNPEVHISPTTNRATPSPTATVGRSEFGEEENHSSSRPCNSADVVENGSLVTSQERRFSSETIGNNSSAGEDSPQLQNWVYQTSHSDLTLAENLEKSKWEGGSCKGAKKPGGWLFKLQDVVMGISGVGVTVEQFWFGSIMSFICNVYFHFKRRKKVLLLSVCNMTSFPREALISRKDMDLHVLGENWVTYSCRVQ